MAKFGMAMGPFTMYDMAGNDIGWEIRKRRYQERPDFVYSKIADRICEQGRFGQKTGKGFYKYEAGQPQADPGPGGREDLCRLPEGDRRQDRARSPTRRSSSD